MVGKGAVILFTVICLAMAGRFQTVLASSDLSKLTHQQWLVSLIDDFSSSFCSICHLRLLSESAHFPSSVRVHLYVRTPHFLIGTGSIFQTLFQFLSSRQKSNFYEN